VRLKNKPKRISEIGILIKKYVATFEDQIAPSQFLVDQSYNIKIIDTYEIILSQVIDPYLQDDNNSDSQNLDLRRANIFKVCSGIELATIYLQPYKLRVNPIADVNLSTFFATYLAQNFLIMEQELQELKGDEFFDEEFLQIKSDHLNLLRYLSNEQHYQNLPTYSNSIYWRTYCRLVKSLTN